MRYLVCLLLVLSNSCLFAMKAPKFEEYSYKPDASWRYKSLEKALSDVGYSKKDISDKAQRKKQYVQYIKHGFPYFERDLSKYGAIIPDKSGGSDHYDLFFVGAVTYPKDVRYGDLSGTTQCGNFVVGYDQNGRNVYHHYFNWYANSSEVMQLPVVNDFLRNLGDIQKIALCAAIKTCRKCMKKSPHESVTSRKIDDKNGKIPVNEFDGLVQAVDSITGATFTILKNPAIYPDELTN